MRVTLGTLRRIIKEEILNKEEVIPSDWTIHAHHVTILFGKEVGKWKDDKTPGYGQEFNITVTGFKKSNEVAAVGVAVPEGLPDDLDTALRANTARHITIATAPGIKPVAAKALMSMKQDNSVIEAPLSLELTGTLEFMNGYFGLILDSGSREALVNAVKNILIPSDTQKTEHLRRLIRSIIN